MKGLPLGPSDFEGRGVLDLELLVKNKAFFTAQKNIPTPNSSFFVKKNCFSSRNNCSGEPPSVLDSTVSGGAFIAVSDADPPPISSNAGGDESGLLLPPQCLEFGAKGCGGGLENLFLTQEQSIFWRVVGDAVEERQVENLNRSLQICTDGVEDGCYSPPEFEFSGGFGIVDQEDPFHSSNPSIFFHLHHEKAASGLPQAKNLNLGGPVNGYLGPYCSHEQLLQPQLFPHQVPTWPGPDPITGLVDQPVHIQMIINQLHNVSELIHTGSFMLAQGILARLNHFLSPSGGPSFRAAFYCKEALQLLLDTNTNNNVGTEISSTPELIFKIAAYKSFSEISPLVEFSNFSRNQALLEAFEGLDRIHIVDFDIGLGSQWASLMQELALRGGARPVLKITALVPPWRDDHLELCLVRENLFKFAGEMSIGFEFEISSVDSFRASSGGVAGVNLPIRCLAEYDVPLPLLLRFVKQMLPRVVATADGGCEMTDLPFAGHVIHLLRSCSNLLESVDAVGLDVEAVRRMERFLIGPEIKRIVAGHLRRQGKLAHWRDMFGTLGFSQVCFSESTWAQAECIVKRARIRGFQVEKRWPSTLALSWWQKELVSVSVYRC